MSNGASASLSMQQVRGRIDRVRHRLLKLAAAGQFSSTALSSIRGELEQLRPKQPFACDPYSIKFAAHLHEKLNKELDELERTSTKPYNQHPLSPVAAALDDFSWLIDTLGEWLQRGYWDDQAEMITEAACRLARLRGSI